MCVCVSVRVCLCECLCAHSTCSRSPADYFQGVCVRVSEKEGVWVCVRQKVSLSWCLPCAGGHGGYSVASTSRRSFL